jgi:hypothetical protein
MRSKIIILAVIIAIYGCGKGGSSPGNGTTPVIVPGKSTLLFPSQNSVCTTGTTAGAQTFITFTWNKADNADLYELNIKNLLTNVITTQRYTGTTAAVPLLNGTPYAWAIVSRIAKDTSAATVSDIWKFYVSGPGAVYYPPFPITVVAPLFNQTITANNGNVNLSWTGSDPDNDIVNYDIYLGTSSTSPALIKSGVTDQFLNNVPVNPATTYYWKVITNDSKGNTSDSGIYQFKVR